MIQVCQRCNEIILPSRRSIHKCRRASNKAKKRNKTEKQRKSKSTKWCSLRNGNGTNKKNLQNLSKLYVQKKRPKSMKISRKKRSRLIDVEITEEFGYGRNVNKDDSYSAFSYYKDFFGSGFFKCTNLTEDKESYELFKENQLKKRKKSQRKGNVVKRKKKVNRMRGKDEDLERGRMRRDGMIKNMVFGKNVLRERKGSEKKRSVMIMKSQRKMSKRKGRFEVEKNPVISISMVKKGDVDERKRIRRKRSNSAYTPREDYSEFRKKKMKSSTSSANIRGLSTSLIVPSKSMMPSNSSGHIGESREKVEKEKQKIYNRILSINFKDSLQEKEEKRRKERAEKVRKRKNKMVIRKLFFAGEEIFKAGSFNKRKSFVAATSPTPTAMILTSFLGRKSNLKKSVRRKKKNRKYYLAGKLAKKTVLLKIFLFLPINEIIKFTYVSKSFWYILNTNELWRILCERDRNISFEELDSLDQVRKITNHVHVFPEGSILNNKDNSINNIDKRFEIDYKSTKTNELHRMMRKKMRKREKELFFWKRQYFIFPEKEFDHTDFHELMENKYLIYEKTNWDRENRIIVDIFRRFDFDRDGIINVDDLFLYFRRFMKNNKIGKEEVERIVRKNNPENKKFINFFQFKKILQYQQHLYKHVVV